MSAVVNRQMLALRRGCNSALIKTHKKNFVFKKELKLSKIKRSEVDRVINLMISIDRRIQWHRRNTHQSSSGIKPLVSKRTKGWNCNTLSDLTIEVKNSTSIGDSLP